MKIREVVTSMWKISLGKMGFIYLRFPQQLSFFLWQPVLLFLYIFLFHFLVPGMSLAENRMFYCLGIQVVCKETHFLKLK